MTPHLAWFIVGILLAILALVAVVGYACLFLSGTLAQREEDAYGVEKARRS